MTQLEAAELGAQAAERDRDHLARYVEGVTCTAADVFQWSAAVARAAMLRAPAESLPAVAP